MDVPNPLGVAQKRRMSIDVQREHRIFMRTYDPKRRDKLNAMYTKAMYEKDKELKNYFDGTGSAPRSRPPTPKKEFKPIRQKKKVPSLKAKLTLSQSTSALPKAFGTGFAKKDTLKKDLSPPDTAKQQSRNLMWETLLKNDHGGDHFEAKLADEAARNKAREVATINLNVVREQQRRKREAEASEKQFMRKALDDDVERFKRIRAKRIEDRRKEAVKLKKDQDKLLRASMRRKVAEEEEEKEWARSWLHAAEMADIGVRKARKAKEVVREEYRVDMKRALRVRQEQLEEKKRRHAEAERIEVQQKKNFIVDAHKERDMERRFHVKKIEDRVKAREALGKTYVGGDKKRRDEIVEHLVTSVVDPEKDNWREMDAMRAQAIRDKDTRAARERKFQAQEDKIKAEIKELEKKRDRAAIDASFLRDTAIRDSKKAMEREKRIREKRIIAKQIEERAHERSRGLDRTGKGVSDVEWRMNQSLIRGKEYQPPSERTGRSERSEEPLHMSIKKKMRGALWGNEVPPWETFKDDNGNRTWGGYRRMREDYEPRYFGDSPPPVFRRAKVDWYE